MEGSEEPGNASSLPWRAGFPLLPETLKELYAISPELGDAVIEDFRLNGEHRRKLESRCVWLAAGLSFVFMVTVIMVASSVVRIAERLAVGWALVATVVPTGLLTFGLWWAAYYGLERVIAKAKEKIK